MEAHAYLKYERIVFYDGECGFCNNSVRFILKNRKKSFYFISLQSELAQAILSKYNIKIDLKTIYFIEGKKIYDRSGAALRIAKNLKGLYQLFYYFGMLVPYFLRDYVYRQIANKRKMFYADRCILPEEDEKEFFVG